MKKNTDILIENLIAPLNAKQKKVLKERYGLGSKKKTLQDIGNDLGVTRERVRQIESQGLKKIKSGVVANFSNLIETAKKELELNGGVKGDDAFVARLASETGIDTSIKNWKEKIRFLLFAAGTPFYFKENPELKSFWYSGETAKKQFFDLVDKTVKLFETSDKNKILGDPAFNNKLKSSPDYHLLFISKQFSVNNFGDIGLAKWPEIRPKNVRDKAYLALKKQGSPLHFRDIAKQIMKNGIGNKSVNIQTVHNELIKDNRFVLVGRGIYALRENGFESGTVKDVIASLIKSRGPLSSEDVIGLVNQKRLLKENTILLNLQNRKHFKRLSDGTYTLREA